MNEEPEGEAFNYADMDGKFLQHSTYRTVSPTCLLHDDDQDLIMIVKR